LETSIINIKNDDGPDQVQDDFGFTVYADYGELLAQGFVPTIDELTRVLLLLDHNIIIEGARLDISIRNDLEGEDLSKAYIQSEKISNGISAIEFDFPDINVTPGQKYYIVWDPNPEEFCTNIGWFAGNNNPYPKADAYWYNPEEGWENFKDFFPEHPDFDFTFVTFGTKNNNIPPVKPIIEGPSIGKSGESYEFSLSSVDHDGDDIYYYIEWFEGCPDSYWDGPYLSGEDVFKSYIWEEQGNYTIRVKAKDKWGEESEWSDPLTVTMPRVKLFTQIPRILSWLIERFPFLQPYISIINVMK